MPRIVFDAELQKFVYVQPKPRRADCAQCGKPLFGRQSKFCSGLCNVRSWRSANREKYRDGQARNYWANPEKSEARWQVKLALQAGRLVRPKTCSSCHAAHKYIEAHHANGYDEQHWLDVTWLCKRCHMRLHRKVVAA